MRDLMSLAIEAATEAGAMLLENYGRVASVTEKSDHSILREAGGRITTLTGGELGVERQQAYVASNGLVHEAILERIRQYL